MPATLVRNVSATNVIAKSTAALQGETHPATMRLSGARQLLPSLRTKGDGPLDRQGECLSRQEKSFFFRSAASISRPGLYCMYEYE